MQPIAKPRPFLATNNYDFYMISPSIEDIYNDYRTAKDYPPSYTLGFFEKDENSLSNLDSINDNDELKYFIELSWQHLNALYQNGRYNDTVNNSIEYLRIIDREIDRHQLAFIKNDWYYGILLFKGMATYHLRDYNTSTPIFKALTEHDSKNQNYKNWLRYSKYGLHLWISRTIAVVCGLLILIEILFEKWIPSTFTGIPLDVVALIGIIGTMVYDYYVKRNFRKSNLK